MSIARHHAEWLSLVEVSGPFLSLPVLTRVFPQGLPSRDKEIASETRLKLEDWQDGHKDRAVHIGWCQFVLRSVLQFPPEVIAEGPAIPPGMEARMAEFGEVLRPDIAIKPPKDAGSTKPRLLIQILPPDQDLEKPLKDKHWKASPATRMTELLHAADVPVGLITNGEHWMLVHAPRGETSGFASWYAPLWIEEPLTFQAFQALLGVQRFFGVPADQTIEALLTQSAHDQQEVTEQLGWQVRKAVEVLIQAFDKIDQDSSRKLLEGVSEKELYEAALTVMMRLVFLMCAEERKVFFQSDCEEYDQFYAVSTLREQLQEVADKHVDEILDSRFDAWSRLLATSRAVYGGVQHEAMRLPPYGGTLFDPDRYPFLEGRKPGTHWRTTPAEPIKVSNRTALHLLNALQILQIKVPGGGPAEARRLSFRALDIEQIGHVYEGLLDHTALRAKEPVLGLKGGKDREPEILLSQLEALAGVHTAQAEIAPETGEPFLLAAETPGNIVSLPTGRHRPSYAPPEKLIEFLQDETGRSAKAIAKALTDQSEIDESRLLLACGQDRLLLDRVWKFAALLRDDTFGFPVVIPTGSLYVTQGNTRRSTGTHYTPRSLTEPIVQHTLEPLVYIGPAEGKPREQWVLKTAREILELKVCDLAMGSGAFHVQTCRYLAERLVEAWENAEKAHLGAFVTTPEGDLSTGAPGERILPADLDERLIIARRAVADRCLYGVDINPMAVEMAKLSLWLITMQRDRPFTFLDHALKCGDSLLGVSTLKQVENFTLRAKEGEYVEHTFATANLFRYVDEASAKRRALESLPSNDHAQIETKNRLHAEAEAATAKVKALADCLIAFELRGLDGEAYEEQRAVAADHAEVAMRKPLAVFQAYAREQLRGRRPFHWPVQFPEVFARGGFDAIVGNPPFMGGTKLEPAFGMDWRDYVVDHIGNNVRGLRGTADLCAYFFLRCCRLVKEGAQFTLLATNTIAEGDTRTVGLAQLLKGGAHITRAVPSMKWPGAASLEVAVVSLHNGLWKGGCFLDDQPVRLVGDDLTEPGEVGGEPHPLVSNYDQAIEGAKNLGMGFIIEPDEAKWLIQRDSRNRNVVFPFLNGEDVNSQPDQSATRWTIYFFEWPLDHRNAPAGYAGPVAADYPDCLKIVEERVKPERMAYPDDSPWNRSLRTKWWQYGLPRPALTKALRGKRRAMVKSAVSQNNFFVFVETNVVFSHATKVFIFEDFAHFIFLQSSFHDEWARKYGSTLESRFRYTPGSCFETFPFPTASSKLNAVGETYHEFRRNMMLSRREGLTKTYNRFHDPGEQSEDIVRLRALHVEMDQVVAAAYGWSDLAGGSGSQLGHGFHETKQGVRYTISESARRTILDRLLALNHQRYEEEVAAGLHDKGARKGKAKKPKPSAGAATPSQTELLPGPQGTLF